MNNTHILPEKTKTILLNIYKNNSRSLISKQKTRGEINCSNKKIRPQKGTGKARISTKSSPIFRGGGRAFPNKNMLIKKKLNKKIYLLLITNLFMEKIKKKLIYKLYIKKSLYKTKNIFNYIKKKNIEKKKFLLIYNILYNKKKIIIFNNLKNIKVLSKYTITPISINWANIIIIL